MQCHVTARACSHPAIVWGADSLQQHWLLSYLPATLEYTGVKGPLNGYANSPGVIGEGLKL